MSCDPLCPLVGIGDIVITNYQSEKTIQIYKTNSLYFIHSPFPIVENHLFWTIGLKLPLIILEPRMSLEGGDVNKWGGVKIMWNVQVIYFLSIGAEN